MKRLSRYVEALRLGAVLDSKAPAGGSAAGQFVLVPLYETIQLQQGGQAVAQFGTNPTVFVNDTLSGTYVIGGVVAVFGTASTSGTMQIEVATGTQAAGAGTNQLTGVVSLSGATNTAVSGVVIASPTQIVTGARVNIIFSGTTTGLANCCISVILQRVA
jgi:limonene-1,2-epoxide hydrolase